MFNNVTKNKRSLSWPLPCWVNVQYINISISIVQTIDLHVPLRNIKSSTKYSVMELNKIHNKSDVQSHILSSALIDIGTPDSPVWIADITLHTA
mgnify:CR=1 FL=1